MQSSVHTYTKQTLCKAQEQKYRSHCSWTENLKYRLIECHQERVHTIKSLGLLMSYTSGDGNTKEKVKVFFFIWKKKNH